MKISTHAAHRPVRPARIEHHAAGATAPPVATARGDRSRTVRYLLALLRISMGWVFLWAFLDKTFGFGHDTTSAQAWIHGGSPTYGFLHFSAAGPFAGTYQDVAGQGWADWLFMIGLVCIGVGLMLGIAMRACAVAAAVMLVLMWSVVLPPASNPFMDDHLIYAMAVLLLPLLHAGRPIGLGGWWERQGLVRRFRALT